MPNWVTNKIQAPSHVIQAMVNADSGRVDFNTIVKFPGPNGDDWTGIYGDAETAAEVVCAKPLSDHPIIAALEKENRKRIDVSAMTDESFKQFIGMIENYRACGYLHGMAYARATWGTKWNACDPSHSVEGGTADFETAWSCPKGALVELSKRFPDDEIKVIYADEDIGSNCGSFTLKGGEIAASDIAPPWQSMTEEQRAKWRAFAYEVKGWEPEPAEED